MTRMKVGKIAAWAGGVALLLAGAACLCFFSSFSSKSATAYLYVDADDNVDSVYAKLTAAAEPSTLLGFRMLSFATGYDKRVKPGRYAVEPSVSTLTLFRRLRNGSQSPVRLTIPVVRTMDRLAAKLSAALQPDSATWASLFADEAFCQKYGYDTATLPALFIPNTYEVYWTVTPDEFMRRMKKENKAFWDDTRRRKAQEAGLSETEVVTLASIVEQETANDAEKPMVAGMYLNRYRRGMKLQADPTVKFALKQFQLRRILNVHLAADSPYNTYKYAGLPPGPICIPSLASIEAVLNYAHHDYIFMCAKEDFSGTHNFAATGEEHMMNARRYAEALDKRGIK